MRLEDESSTLGLLVTTELEVLASLEGELCLGLVNVRWGSWSFSGDNVPCTKCILVGARPSWWFSPSAELLDE